jgi:hypothetical protein
MMKKKEKIGLQNYKTWDNGDEMRNSRAKRVGYRMCLSNEQLILDGVFLVNDLILRTSYYLMMNEWPWINTIPQTKQKLESKMAMNHIIPPTKHLNSVLAY